MPPGVPICRCGPGARARARACVGCGQPYYYGIVTVCHGQSLRRQPGKISIFKFNLKCQAKLASEVSQTRRRMVVLLF